LDTLLLATGAIGKPEHQVRKASSAHQVRKLWQQQARIEIMRCNHSARMLVILFNRSQAGVGRDDTPQSLYYCLFVPHIYGCCLSRTGPMQPMRLHWAPRHGVCAVCSFLP